ncbi:hypothetical protein SAMN02799630_02967 [Paenibacillus sp. UNCCL117]|uniref:hypothetical protein n=1 Tax=unclassified Paenibacillus TaxID=185978 RepID=UPI00088A04F1|nr:MULTISPECIES: hypothetical protein [unclassified Paenibacillus]SDE23923.1 hypothetical protein SAMN04488602_12289 [Paenibacillus sp. cl123]SFW42460.1 hypothetical protein SAMN02799630_02967 [Paenibacillus sp. UNCCL117]
MNNEITNNSAAGTADREEARRLLDESPDIVFEERLRLEIDEEAAGFWMKFTAEWGGALYLLDETNKKRYEHGLLDEESYEWARRCYRLGLIGLSELYDRLKAWTEEENRDERFLYAMNSIDCFLVPGYLDDYSRVHEAGADLCRHWIGEIRERLSSQAPIEEAVAAIHTMASEYIKRMHLYAAG